MASSATYLTARQYLLRQRESVAVAQSYVAARLAARNLSDGETGLDALLAATGVLSGGRALLQYNGAWLVSGVGVSETDIPAAIRNSLELGKPSRQRVVIDSLPTIFTAIPIVEGTTPTATFIGIVSLQELQRTMIALRNALFLGSALAAVCGGIVGWWLARRVSEPLRRISEAAELISTGNLEVRVSEPHERDLAKIAHSFNAMTESLKARINREARFAAQVSHELRSPLTVIRGATELITSSRDALPPRAQLGADLLDERVASFEKILTDLIEISRYESGVVVPDLEVRQIEPLVRALLAHNNIDETLLTIDDSARGANVLVDVRRIEYSIANLVSNASLYAGGLTGVRVDGDDATVTIHVDDAGHGIHEAERQRIFEPFARGLQHSSVEGSGLGLAIVAEHVNAMKATINVSTSPEGGGRFSITLRLGEPL
ncbi:MAG: HAMP domain-containing sensor histidine kinase [Ilumatobacteraceae bacterium]